MEKTLSVCPEFYSNLVFSINRVLAKIQATQMPIKVVTQVAMVYQIILITYHPHVPGPPLKGPTISAVIQPP
jgi:hypothetical protein